MMSPESEQQNAEATAEGKNKTDNVEEKENDQQPTKFDGKILYNPDGSTYIIEDADLGDNELPRQEGCILDEAGNSEAEAEKSYPQIANAFVVSRSSAYYNALYGQAMAKLLLEQRSLPETPIVHSYRVLSARKTDGSMDQAVPQSSSASSTLNVVPPVKPILMCFICKLSFACGKSFANHCGDSHTMVLSEDEQSILESQAKNTSAIVQYVGKEQDVTLSFLEPVLNNSVPVPVSSPASNPLNNLVSSLMNKSSPTTASSSTSGAIANFLSVALQQSKASSSSSLPVPISEAASVASLLNQKASEDQEGENSRSSSFTRYSSPSPSGGTSAASNSTFLTPATATNANMLQGTTIGACPDHVNGRPTGVECSQCDLILSSSRMAGGSAWNVSRNSCKTLKCPKCNWHYKYQETLEIHMKEKHPESETTCIYCITGQQHPRLARGETYTCGYKPYRCEVCNYSTTTKGNLSIHMQSDKHLNNMQELQNGGPASVITADKISNSSPGTSRQNVVSLPPTISSSPSKAPSPKPTWRCDVCNYDTNVARNLRIHMTSEKHTHNMMALSQQNVNKSMQQLSVIQQMMDPMKLFGGGNPTTAPPATSEAALADLAFNQAVLAQMMSNSQASSPAADLNLAAFAAAAAASTAASTAEESPEALQEKQNEEDQNATTMFSCCVCREFGCDSIDDLSIHLNVDRSRTREHEVSLFIGGHYLCQLCNYKTNLKANFQLHCKTDKHLQRLSHVNHIKEGGPSNEWKLRYLTSINPVELRCNACDFYTNSPHKLQVHVANQQHQAGAVLFTHLQKMEATIQDTRRSYNCILCKFASKSKPGLMGHVRTMKHLQMEQIHQLQKRAEGNMSHTEIGDIFTVLQLDEDTAAEAANSPKAASASGEAAEGDEEAESTQQSNNAESGDSSGDGGADISEESSRSCPLCSEKFPSQERLESHAMSVHSVNSEGLQRLQSLINGSHWLNKKDGENNNEEELKKSSNFSYSLEKYMDPNRPFKCDVCKESFTQKNILLVHYNSVSHLHRLKKTMQESSNSMSASASTSTPEKNSKSSALEALLGNIRGEKKGEDDNEVKPYKCNICKVAYSQGSTLDIHIRSVLHQSKASKLQELMMTGQIDMSKPLIEQPEPAQLQEQHKKMIADMLLSPKSLNSTGSSNPQTSPNLRSSSPTGKSSPQSSPLANILMPDHQQDSSSDIMKNLLSKLTSTPKSSSQSEAETSPDFKNLLLQNYGMDLVKQFNEMKRKNEDAEESSEAKRVKENGAAAENDCSEVMIQPSSRAETPTAIEDNKEKPTSQVQHQPNIAEMQEALQRAMMGAQLQQMNPMMMQMAQLQGLNPLIAMNLYPPLIPPNLLKQPSQAGNTDLLAPLFQAAGGMDPKLLALMSAAKEQQQQQQPPKNLAQMISLLGQGSPMPPISSAGFPTSGAGPAFPAMPGRPDQAPGGLILPQQPVMHQEQGKRARTRISDDQLKILRANFDINNSPAEETLNKMSAQTGLPLKVIKHWFRNTLFKERQKNKDSPYNFNNPPSTKLNLEEYEKTGEPKVTPLNLTDQEEYIKAEAAKKEILQQEKKEKSSSAQAENNASSPKVPTTTAAITSSVNNETSSSTSPIITVSNAADNNPSPGLTLSRLLGPHLTPGALGGPGGQPPPLLPNFPAFPLTTSSLSTTPPMPEYLNTLARQNPRPQSPQSVGSGQGKRANRTRFTDYQIKVLQEFFENNAYPKDDDLEYLSKLLGLSPRVIVVWFQNARQKARKIYENQPPAEAQEGDEASGRFTRTSGCNYQCKKCLLVFQRYYELIRHQKQHCYKEEDARRSAQAQKAAAQAAAQFVGPPPALVPITSEESRSSVGDDRSITSPTLSENKADLDHHQQQKSASSESPLLNFPPHTPFGILQQQALQMQQRLAQSQQNLNTDSGDEYDEFDESNASSPNSKRKLSDDGELDDETLQHRDKRLRTTIMPEQLDFLFQKYQVESNPSRKSLEQIAAEVGLRKRVVQVWFQNTRARERKGLTPVLSSSKMCKKCPFCSDIFKVRSALEVHLATKHPDQPTNIVDIDALPNIEGSSEDEAEDQVNHPVSSVAPPAFDMTSMRKYYEDTMKRFMNDLADQKQQYPPSNCNNSESNNQALDLTSSFNNEEDDSDHNNRSIDDGSSTTGCGNGSNNKRFRTQMSGVQVKMMKAIFEAYKTPTMTECSTLGREIGLQKRVVQVWFQNARAKEKRARLQLQQATGREPDPPLPPEHCIVCPGFSFGPRFAVQDHLFTKAHLEQLRIALEQGRYDPESPGNSMAQAAAALSTNGANGAGASSPTNNETSLSMLQMTSQMNDSSATLFDIPAKQNPRMLMQV